MEYYEDLKKFLKEEDDFFIEVEGKSGGLEKFIKKYNESHGEKISLSSDGIIKLEDDANKWGLEFRLYVKSKPSVGNFLGNRAYRPNYSYRLNDNDVIKQLLDDGFIIGLN